MADMQAKPLNDKQLQFCLEYIVDFNATQAAIRAGYSKRTAATQAYDLLRKPEIQAEIRRQLEKRQERTQVTADMVLTRWWQIATVDVNELVQYRRESCSQCWPELEPQAKPKDPDRRCQQCGGEGFGHMVVMDSTKLSPAARALYQGVKVTKEGLEVKMADRDGALLNAAKHIGMFTERVMFPDKDGAPQPVAADGGAIGGAIAGAISDLIRAALDEKTPAKG